MAARIIDGKAVAQAVRGEVALEVSALAARGVRPGLAVVLVGADPASEVYVRNKTKAAREVGVDAFDHHLPSTTTQRELLELVARLNADERVDGILVQLPLPAGLDATAVLDAIDPGKDVDGFHPMNVGRLWTGMPLFVPCTPVGVMRLLREAGAQLAGADAVVLGRSNLVGKPVAALLMAENATVTICHSRTRNLPEVIRRADVLVAAIGRPRFVQGDWIKEGAIVMDVGINRVDGKLCGDVDYDAALPRAGAITPVPGGVGPMTIAMLLQSTVASARRRRAP